MEKLEQLNDYFKKKQWRLEQLNNYLNVGFHPTLKTKNGMEISLAIPSKEASDTKIRITKTIESLSIIEERPFQEIYDEIYKYPKNHLKINRNCRTCRFQDPKVPFSFCSIPAKQKKCSSGLYYAEWEVSYYAIAINILENKIIDANNFIAANPKTRNGKLVLKTYKDILSDLQCIDINNKVKL